jgi:hypothetical protein
MDLHSLAMVAALTITVLAVFLFQRARLSTLGTMAFIVLVAIVAGIAPVLAQADTPAAPTAYSPNTLFHIPQAAWDQINAMVVALLLAFVTLAFRWLIDHSPLKNTQAEAITREAFETLLRNGAKYGLTQLESAETRVSHVDVGDSRVAAAANYIIAQGPKLAAKLGFDVQTPEGRAAIIRMATVRLADLMTPPDAPPAPVLLPPIVQPPANSGVKLPPAKND